MILIPDILDWANITHSPPDQPQTSCYVKRPRFGPSLLFGLTHICVLGSVMLIWTNVQDYQVVSDSYYTRKWYRQ